MQEYDFFKAYQAKEYWESIKTNIGLKSFARRAAVVTAEAGFQEAQKEYSNDSGANSNVSLNDTSASAALSVAAPANSPCADITSADSPCSNSTSTNSPDICAKSADPSRINGEKSVELSIRTSSMSSVHGRLFEHAVVSQYDTKSLQEYQAQAPQAKDTVLLKDAQVATCLVY
ncbi:hypothetical protein FBU30_006814 [Linnemannia zychae]|nr:hypothetical protein FBU30_006814 [Linnemannia zychae]